VLESAGSKLAVDRQDCGAGLNPDGAPRIFDAFFTTKPDGMGTGLSISRSIVDAHGDRLWALQQCRTERRSTSPCWRLTGAGRDRRGVRLTSRVR